ncbi:MAG: GNAT family N-acetyltransferase [Hyphomicrobiales bacterium]|nr:GNAT family N-acetyltransferase [Hyphomicrobiales bacterium]
MLNVPEWFGTAAWQPPIPGKVVGIRAPVDGESRIAPRQTGNGWHYVAADQRYLVEAVNYQAAAMHFDAWMALAERAMEANAFYDPCFALPAALHLAVAKRPQFLLVWDETGGERARLCGLLPFHYRRTLTGRQFAENWLHDFAALGTPLVDREHAIETIDLMLDWLRRQNGKTVGLMFRKLRGDGPVVGLLRTRTALTGRETREFDQHERAALLKGESAGDPFLNTLSSKKRRELRRQRNRLSDQGTLSYTSARRPDEVRAATEEFMALEAAGWKGERGTAFLNDPGNSTFLRTLTRLLARDGKCRIDALRLDGKPVAMGITLRDRDCAWLWKITFEEDYGASSPGVQLLMDFTRTQLAEAGVQLTDSAAIPNHPMINHIWRDRIAITDALISMQTYQTRGFALHAALEHMQRWTRELAKTIYYKLRNYKRS